MADAADLWRFLPVGYALTVALEMPVLLVGLSRVHPWRRRMFAGFWLNAVSYPVVVLTLPVLIDATSHRLAYTVVAELFAPLIEATMFVVAFDRDGRLTTRQRVQDIVTVVLANVASFLIGDWVLSTHPGSALLRWVFQ